MKQKLLLACVLFSLLIANTVKAQIPTKGLVAYYPFSGNANDSSGNGNNGTVNGATLTTDRFGNKNCAYKFNGKSSNISTSFLPPTGDNARTFSLWFKNRSTNLNAYSFLSYGANTGDCSQAGGNFSLEVYSSLGDFGDSGYRFRLDGSCTTTCNTKAIDSNWHQAILVINPQLGNVFSTSEIYIDGILQVKNNYNGTTLINTLTLNSLKIGYSQATISTGGRFFNGNIDDIRIYNRSLDSIEVQALYHENGYNNTLPLKITDVEATNKKEITTINWQTETELNTRNFIIQNSTDGTSFTDLGTVKAIGSGANGYSYTDNRTVNGLNYYRLKCVDNTGGFTYSQVVFVQVSVNNNQVTVYPNPTKDKVTIVGNINQIKLLDNTGNVLISKQTNTNKTTIDVSTLSRGLYFIQYRNVTGEVKTEKLVVE